jgi:hypothetical protein
MVAEEMSPSIRFPFWEPNRRPKTGFEVVAVLRQVSGFTANPSPSSDAGTTACKANGARAGGESRRDATAQRRTNQGRNSFLWSGWWEMVVEDDFGVYYQGVTRSAGFETVLRQVGVPSALADALQRRTLV